MAAERGVEAAFRGLSGAEGSLQFSVSAATEQATEAEETDRPSFPGLASFFFKAEALIHDLPLMAVFSTTEATEAGEVQHIWEWRPTVDPTGELQLSATHTKLLQRLYKGAKKVSLSMLHGGYSGSMVLMANSVDMEGSHEEPTIVKLDKKEDLMEEVERTRAMLKHIDKSAAQIIKPPEYIGDHGGVVLEMAGACWVLPQFAADAKRMDIKLLMTLREVIMEQFRLSAAASSEHAAPSSSQSSTEASKMAEASDLSRHVVRELWGVGGALHRLATATAFPSERLATSGIGARGAKVAEKLCIALLPCFPGSNVGEPDFEKRKAQLPSSLRAELDGLVSATLLQWGCDKGRKFDASFVHVVPSAGLKQLVSEANVQPFAELLHRLRELGKGVNVPDWLSTWHPLRWHRHGDLNAANIMVDVKQTSWLIDFATSEVGGVFDDCAKLVSSMIFQYLFAEGCRAITEDDVGKSVALNVKGSVLTVAGQKRVVEWAAVAKDRPSMDISGTIAKVEPGIEGSVVLSNGSAFKNPSLAEATAERARRSEMVVDAFVPVDGATDIWDTANRMKALPPSAPPSVKDALSALNIVLEYQCRLVQACHGADADLHPIAWHLPLLLEALKSLVYVDIKPWQKKLAWHTACRLAKSICADLRRSPKLAPPLGVAQKKPLKLAVSTARFLRRHEGRKDWQLLHVQERTDDGTLRLRALEGVAEGGAKSPGQTNLLAAEGQLVFFDELFHAAAGRCEADAFDALIGNLEAAGACLRRLKPRAKVLKGDKEEEPPVGLLGYVVRELQPTSLRQSVTDQASAVNHKNAEPVKHATLVEWANVWANALFRKHDAVGLRCYDAGQELVVLRGDAWTAVRVLSCELYVHDLQPTDGGAPFKLPLHVHNHAPLEMAMEEFDAQRMRYQTALSTVHATIPDALSGRRLDVFAQCVPIKIVAGSGNSDSQFDKIREVRGVSDFLHAIVEKRRAGETVCTNVLVVAGPAAGKTCMTSQLTMEAFRREDEFAEGVATRWGKVSEPPADGVELVSERLSIALAARIEEGDEEASFTKEQFEAFGTGRVHRGHYIQVGTGSWFRPIMGPGLIPIQIKVMDLQRKLAMDVHEHLFASMWNYVDAYLQLLYGAGSLRYLFLRQALMARRALIILDGIDEGGANKDRIQRHVTDVLAAQGHPLLVTSRPAGLSDTLYGNFNKLQMKPLTDDQQTMIVRSRLKAINDEAHVGDFVRYIRESMPIDDTTGERITGNPLMLTMVCCIYESHRSVEKMPERVVELYRTASDIMLSHVEKKHRAKGGQPQQLKPLLMRIALATHSALKRQIVAKDIDKLLDLEVDEKLQVELRTTWASVQQQLTEGRIPLLSMLQREPHAITGLEQPRPS